MSEHDIVVRSAQCSVNMIDWLVAWVHVWIDIMSVFSTLVHMSICCTGVIAPSLDSSGGTWLHGVIAWVHASLL
jgi:hypothetical protein